MAPPQRRRAGQQVRDRRLEHGDVVPDRHQARFDQVPHERFVDGVELTDEPAPLGHQPPAMRTERTQPAADRIGRIGCEIGSHRHQIAGDHGGVDPIGLGQLADGAGKVAHAGGSDDIDLEARRMKAVGQPAFIAARGLQPDVDRAKPGETLDQLRDFLRRCAAAQALCAGMDMHVELHFGNVDADIGRVVYHGLAPRLVVRAKARSTVRGQREQAGPSLTAAFKSQSERTAACLHWPGCASRPVLTVNHIASTQARG
jgi:hypothetical protein